MNDSIGIDISKAHLDVYHPADTGTSARFSNDPTGFRALTRFIGPKQPDLVVYEATGPYHARFEQPVCTGVRDAGKNRCGGRPDVGSDGLSPGSGSRRACG